MGAQLASRSQGNGTAQPATAGEISTRVDALWLAALHRIGARVSHEVKGALNGVSVNVEVVRSRAEKPSGELSSVRSFANAAADQLNVVIAMTDGLLALARPVREPVEIAVVVQRLEALLGPVARADGRQLEVGASLDALGATTAGGSAVWLAIGECLLAALDASAHVRCVAASSAGLPGIRLESVDGATIAVDAAVIAAVTDAGIRVVAEPSAISLSFPS